MYKDIKHFTFLLLIISIVSVIFYYLFFASSWAILNYLFLYKDNISKSSNKIVVIKIDNKTLDELQKIDLKVLNLNKKIFSDLIDKLNNYWVKAIWFDVVFQNITDDINILKESFDKYKNIVIAAKIKDTNNPNDTQELPLELFNNATWWSIWTLKDKDNFNYVTRFKPVYFLDKVPIESFSIALYKKYIQENKSIWQQNNEYIINPFTKIPLDEDWNMIIRFFN
jgi:CHASE2 domain-containing sensor protein